MVSTAPAPILRRLSRLELALNRKVWSIHGGVYVLFAAATFASALALPEAPRERTLGFALFLALIAVVHLASRPPAIGTPANHAVIAATYVLPTLAFVTVAPASAAAIGGAMFIAPLTAVRLQRRWEIAAHMVALAILFGSLALAGALFDVVDQPTQIALLLLIVGNWVQAFSCLSVLEAAEAQGEELERLVRRDPITGLGNRRLLDERLVDDIEVHRLDRTPLTLIGFDLEGFDAFVQREGLSATHDLLKRLADGLVEALPREATVIRQADDEFCVVLPETSAVEAVPSVNAVSAVLAGFDLKGWGLKSATGVGTWPDDATDGPVLLHVVAERMRAAAIARDKAAGGPGAGAADSATTPKRRATDR